MKHAVGGPEGFVVVDKPAGCTSHDVVATVRRALRERRVGHGGTLDPDAEGVLVVAVGRATRLLRFVTDLDKTYTGEVVLGTATTTLDSSGTVTATVDMSGISLDDVAAAAATMTGTLDQIPPMVSAIRVGGKRLYELARVGEEVERAPRKVTVSRFDVGPGPEPGVFAIEVACSSGTYVRSLAADLGSALGGVAHLRRLVRTRVGGFTREAAIAPETVTEGTLRRPVELIGHLDAVEVTAEVIGMVEHGRVLDDDTLGVFGSGPWAITSGGRLLGVYERHGAGRAKPMMIYSGADDRSPGSSAPSTFADSVVEMRTEA